jgi:predicted ferric reductase
MERSAGIGVTPFSGVLTDLQHHELERIMSDENPTESGYESGKGSSPYEDHRRVDFHWMVRDKNNLLWFSDLLNEVSRANKLDRSHLDIRIRTYVTQNMSSAGCSRSTGLMSTHNRLSLVSAIPRTSVVLIFL